MRDIGFVEYRLAKKSDLATIARLSREYIEHGLGWSWTPERLKKSYTCRDTNILVACASPNYRAQNRDQKQLQHTHNHQVVGFGVMHYGNTEANLNLLAVLPDYRRMGIGRFMVQWLENSALTAGIDVIYLQCRTVNISAQQFYHKLGYRKLRNLPQYYSAKESAILMGHDLLIPAPHLFLQKPY